MIKLVLGANKTITLTFQEHVVITCIHSILLYFIVFYCILLYFILFFSKESNKQHISIVIQWRKKN